MFGTGPGVDFYCIFQQTLFFWILVLLCQCVIVRIYEIMHVHLKSMVMVVSPHLRIISVAFNLLRLYFSSYNFKMVGWLIFSIIPFQPVPAKYIRLFSRHISIHSLSSFTFLDSIYCCSCVSLCILLLLFII